MMSRPSTHGSSRSLSDFAIGVIPILFLCSGAFGAICQMPGQTFPGLPPISVEQSEHGIRATMGSELLDIVVCSDSVIHVVAVANADAELGRKPWMLEASESCPGVPFQFAHDASSPWCKS